MAEKGQGTTTEDQALRPSIPVANVGPPATAIPIIDLNDNVYLELKYIWPEAEEEKAPELTRRPIFALPDPDLSDEIGEETSATWLELFGDVFYVGFLATFTHEHHIVDQHELGIYAAWFVVVWWSWCSAALYSSRYDTSDVMHHVYKIIELCGLVGMAGASSGFWDNPHGFIIGYMGTLYMFPPSLHPELNRFSCFRLNGSHESGLVDRIQHCVMGSRSVGFICSKASDCLCLRARACPDPLGCFPSLPR